MLAHLKRGQERTALPAYVQMRPEIPDGAPRFVEQSHGQGAGWMGPALTPFTIDQDPSKPDYRVGEFRLPDGLSLGRLDDRRRLLQSVDDQARQLEAIAEIHALSGHYSRAYDLLTNRKAIEAFDLTREDPRLRDRYGWHAHGQSVLQARRLVEAGVPLVTVFWPNEGLTNVSVYWDTHNRNFIDLKTRLMPPADQAFSALARRPLGPRPSRRDPGRLDRRVRPHAARRPERRRRSRRRPRRPRSLGPLLQLGHGRRRHQGRNRPRRIRPLGRLPRPRPGHPRRHRRHDLPLPGRRPRHRADRFPQPPDGTLPGPTHFRHPVVGQALA